jgi:hypothetical protein
VRCSDHTSLRCWSSSTAACTYGNISKSSDPSTCTHSFSLHKLQIKRMISAILHVRSTRFYTTHLNTCRPCHQLCHSFISGLFRIGRKCELGVKMATTIFAVCQCSKSTLPSPEWYYGAFGASKQIKPHTITNMVLLHRVDWQCAQVFTGDHCKAQWTLFPVVTPMVLLPSHQIAQDTGEAEHMTTWSDLRTQRWAIQTDGALNFWCSYIHGCNIFPLQHFVRVTCIQHVVPKIRNQEPKVRLQE